MIAGSIPTQSIKKEHLDMTISFQEIRGQIHLWNLAHLDRLSRSSYFKSYQYQYNKQHQQYHTHACQTDILLFWNW